MAPTAAQIATLRRMVAEPTVATYSDALLTTFIETYPLMDERGEYPYTWSSATPPVKVTNTSWVETYDLCAAAAAIWQEKAATYASQYDFSADGGNYSRSQAYQQMLGQARYYAARRSPKTMTATMWPKETRADRFGWIGNLPEDDD
jgi:hypothetical protein